MKLRHWRAALSGIAALGLVVSPCWAGAGSTARESLDRARVATQAIELPGDQSAALRSIACVLAELDPALARVTVAGMRRPSDVARALGAVAVAVAAVDPEAARQDASTAGRLLLRIPDAAQRAVEQRLLLGEIAVLGEGALNGAQELPPREAQLAVVVGRARSDPSDALALLRGWQLEGAGVDQALSAIAVGLAAANPEEALTLVATIGSSGLRDEAFWLIGERRPAAEEVGVAQRVSDAVVKSALLASAAARMAPDDLEGSLAAAREVAVAPDSALAGVAVALAATDRERAVELARSLPERPRRWTLGRIAVECAARDPRQAEELLAEAGGGPEMVRLAAARMVRVDADRAIRLVNGLAEGEGREAALAAVVAGLAESDPARATDVVWKTRSSQWRDRAIRSLAPVVAQRDADAATSLIGLACEPRLAGQIRSELAPVVADRQPDLAMRLLRSLPPSRHRTEGAFQAAARFLSAGGDPGEALRLAGTALERELALRWLVPTLARSRVRSPINLAEEIGEPYLQALALVAVAVETLGSRSQCRAAPERARQVRTIVEWEGG